MLDSIKTKYQDKGYVFTWTVPTDAIVHTACNMAWITYKNVGSVKEPSGKVIPLQWLESAVLQKAGYQWQIQFFHSTLVPSAAADRH